MKAIVCVKQVPDTSGKVAVKADGTMDRASMATITNPDDMNAIEAALKLKDETGCEVTVVSMGPPPAEGMLRELLAMGADKAVLVSGREFGGSDTYATSQILAAALKKVGVDEYYAEVLPEDKANFVEKEKAEGRKVIMIGDGINDSPALSAADVGIAISEGAEIAREIADITVAADDLAEILVLRMLSNRLMKRIHKNYRFIVTFNAGLILLGVGGILQPTTSALLHNTSTLYIGLKSMGNLLDEPV